MVREFCLYNEIANSEGGMFGPESVTTPAMLNEALSECEKGDAFNLYVNSPGGSVFAGVAMCAMIDRARAKGVTVNAYIDGIAASAASFLVMACDNIKAYESSFMMVHKPWSFVIGNANDLRKEADTLEKLEEDSLLPLYMRKAKVSADEVGSLLTGENWLGSTEMAEIFEIDVINEEKKVEQFAAEMFEKYHYHAPDEVIRNENGGWFNTETSMEMTIRIPFAENSDADDFQMEDPDNNSEESIQAKARERPVDEKPDEAYYQKLKNQVDCI